MGRMYPPVSPMQLGVKGAFPYTMDLDASYM